MDVVNLISMPVSEDQYIARTFKGSCHGNALMCIEAIDGKDIRVVVG